MHFSCRSLPHVASVFLIPPGFVFRLCVFYLFYLISLINFFQLKAKQFSSVYNNFQVNLMIIKMTPNGIHCFII